MMLLNTVRQILDVLKACGEFYAMGNSLKHSYQLSVQKVAQSNKVAYQTIGDACRRRLRLNNIDEFYELVKKWIEGDLVPLKKKLMDNTYENYYDEIELFFENNIQFHPERTLNSNNQNIENETETFSIKLSKKEAQILKILSEVDGVSPKEFLSRIILQSMKSKIEEFAKEIN